MVTSAASPVAVLDAGKVYDLPKALAKELCQANVSGGPYAVAVGAHEKANRIPPQPDPEDVPDWKGEDEPDLDGDEE
jgi:hypothetical protein